MADGGGGGGGAGGLKGGTGGAQVGGDDGAKSGNSGTNLVPTGFTVGTGSNGGNIATAGGNGQVVISW